jgi:hypothetical protein
LTFHVLGADSKYAAAAASLSFPQIAPGDLLPFLQQARAAGDQNAVLAQFRLWLQQRLGSASTP